MANFEFQWSNFTTSVPLSNQTGFNCNYKAPDNKMTSATNLIVASAGDGNNLNEVEQYCASAYAVISGITNASKNIRDGWDSMENDCHHWRNWFRWCEDKGRYCYMTENELESAEAKWRAMHNTNLANQSQILQIWQNATDQLVLDNQQATDQAILDQLIAETNNIISISAYQTESKELDLMARKTRDIFLPIIIGIILLGVGFFMLKK